MEKCCINGCDSHKHIGEKNIGYFPFPMHDEILMKKWLAQMNLPNWKPEAHHRICSMHFCTNDVDSHPNRKQPFLNPTSVPTMFPGKVAGTANLNWKEIDTISTATEIAQPSHTLKINGNGGCDMSQLQSMPVFLIPVQGNVQNAMHISAQYTAQILTQKQSSVKSSVPITAQDSQELQESPNPVPAPTEELSERSVQQWPIVQPRLRKILPKPDFLIIPNVEGLPAVPNILQSVSLPQPDVFFVPNIVNSTPNGSAITYPSRYSGNKRAVLRISINKHHNRNGRKEASCASVDKPMDISSDENDTDDSMNRANSSDKSITIENTSINRAVTFRLDPKSGEIVVTTQRIDDTLKDEEDKETTRTERKVDYACEQPSAAKLRQLYTKNQRECNALRKRLRLLRQRHREEQEEIEKLQEHLTQIGDEVETTCREETSVSLGIKRKELENCVHSSNDDDFENLLHEVKKMKRDIRVTKGLSTISNGQLEFQQSVLRPTDHNRDTRLLEGKNDLPKITQSTDGKILGEINDQCKDASRTINACSIDVNPNSGSDVTIYREEFLDAEFLFE